MITNVTVTLGNRVILGYRSRSTKIVSVAWIQVLTVEVFGGLRLYSLEGC